MPSKSQQRQGSKRGRVASPASRGRPQGSVKLTTEMKESLLSFIEAGAYDYIAAECVGIDERTLREWIQRGEGRHPTRRPTPELRAFAAEVRTAKARGRAAREIEVARKDPKWWLAHVARSKPGRPGWTDLVPDSEEAFPRVTSTQPTAEEITEALQILVDAGAIDLPATSRNQKEQDHE